MTAGYVYLLGSSQFGWYKIGKARIPAVRLRDIGILLPFKVEVFALWRTSNRHRLEREMHDKYASFRTNGEWFCFGQDQATAIVRDPQPLDAMLHPVTMNVSNLSEDVVMPKGRGTIRTINDLRDSQKRAQSKAFMDAVNAYLADNSLPRNSETLRKARKAIVCA